MFKKWWLIRPFYEDDALWVPGEFFTILGYPLCGFMNQAMGPYDSFNEAIVARDGWNDRSRNTT